jgi:hypothetical protein
MNKLKLINAFIGPIGFIILGANLVQKHDKLAVIIGYVNICFGSVLLLFAFYKLIKKNKA